MKENKERRKFRRQQLEKKDIGRKRETKRRAGAAGAPSPLPQHLRQSLPSVRSTPQRFVRGQTSEPAAPRRSPGPASLGGSAAGPGPKTSRSLCACVPAAVCAHSRAPDERTPPSEGSVRAAEPLFTLDFISTAAPGAPRRAVRGSALRYRPPGPTRVRRAGGAAGAKG